MTNIIDLLNLEEGRKLRPYLCSNGYPTVGIGFRIGPKGADIKQYQFTLTDAVCDAWLLALIDNTITAMNKRSLIAAALAQCNEAQAAVLISMAYQMGVSGLANFKMMLTAIAQQQWATAGAEMMNSLWAKQTPNRAKRHQQQLLTGLWLAEYGEHSHVG